MFATEYESFLIDDEPKYNVFELDDLCSSTNCLIGFASKSDSPLTSLELKPLPNSLKYSFLGLDESLPMIIDVCLKTRSNPS